MTETDPFDVLDATWPAASSRESNGWVFRDGAGGGKRVSAATPTAKNAEITHAERVMSESGQTPLFRLGAGDGDVDQRLAALGYEILDPTLLLAVDVARIAALDLPPVRAFPIWPPLVVTKEIWARGGIGAGRLAVMDRAAAPKAGILGRANDRPAGAAFGAMHRNVCMVHAVEVDKIARRQGVARDLMICAAKWAQDHGADTLLVAVTEQNAAANALYRSLGMEHVGQYHYRQKPLKAN